MAGVRAPAVYAQAAEDLRRCAANGGPVSARSANLLAAVGLRVDYSGAFGPWLAPNDPGDAKIACIRLFSMAQAARDHAAALKTLAAMAPYCVVGCLRPMENGQQWVRNDCPVHATSAGVEAAGGVA